MSRISRSRLLLALFAVLALGGQSPDTPHGVEGNQIYNRGRLVGAIDPGQINCLGHATGVGSAVFPYNDASLADTLAGLGYVCMVGEHDILGPVIAEGFDLLVVYLHMYAPAWRDCADRDLSYTELADKYGWSQDSWRQPYVFFDAAGNSLPIDYHALGYNHSTEHWEWVAQARRKPGDGGYPLDSTLDDDAAHDPDQYYKAGRVLVAISCYR